MDKVELLLPAGNIETLRAAVANGADAVYLGLSRFNARQFAGNFSEENIASVIRFCHSHKVKVYVALNTLVKNDELLSFFHSVAVCAAASADAIIIQDAFLIPTIKSMFPRLQIHLSTQAFTINTFAIPPGVDRVILPRELTMAEITAFAKTHAVETFIHGALCFSYSGQCLFSSIAGGRSGNRGRCAQPCRKRYDGRYLMSTKDLCTLNRIPELIKSGVVSLKIEGRMRTPLYVATAARVYRKAIDSHYHGSFSVDEKDIKDLMLAFNREFTEGFAFVNASGGVVDSRKPMNRGLYLGDLKDGKIMLCESLSVGDGVGIWLQESVIGNYVTSLSRDSVPVQEARTGEIVTLGIKGSPQLPAQAAVYKTSSRSLAANLGDEPRLRAEKQNVRLPHVPRFKPQAYSSKPMLCVRVYAKEDALAADEAGADIIYYDILKDDIREVSMLVKHSRLFAATPRVADDATMLEIAGKVKALGLPGVLAGNRGYLSLLKGIELHADYSLNCFNDLDVDAMHATPIISPELSLDEIRRFANKRFIVMVHGDLVLMTTKNPLHTKVLTDDDGRKFPVRESHGVYEVLNSSPLGLFNLTAELLAAGIRYFYIDTRKDVGKMVKTYRRILSGEKVNDRRLRRGFTTGHMLRGVA